MTKSFHILVLDDESERITMFENAIATSSVQIIATFAKSGGEFLNQWRNMKNEVHAISLDHDLALNDPLDGLDVVKALIESSSEQRPPVIVHSSNGARSQRMIGDLDLDGWPTERVGPFGENWAQDHWLPTVIRSLQFNTEKH